MTNEKMKETISITAPDGTVYEFEKPDSFDVEIERVIGNIAYGYVYSDKVINGIVQQSWELIDGKGYSYLIDGKQNLTPITKKCFKKIVSYINEETQDIFIVHEDNITEDEFNRETRISNEQ